MPSLHARRTPRRTACMFSPQAVYTLGLRHSGADLSMVVTHYLFYDNQYYNAEFSRAANTPAHSLYVFATSISLHTWSAAHSGPHTFTFNHLQFTRLRPGSCSLTMALNAGVETQPKISFTNRVEILSASFKIIIIGRLVYY